MMLRYALLAAALGAATPAFAQDEPAQEPPAEPMPDAGEAEPMPEEAAPVTGSGFGLDLNVTLLSDYRFRGVSRSDEDPAVQAAMTLSHDSGLYAGARGTTLKG